MISFLHSAADLAAGVLVAYYNGVRMRGQETLEGEETGYAIFVEVNLRKDQNAEHMDIPPEVTALFGTLLSIYLKLVSSFFLQFCETSVD